MPDLENLIRTTEKQINDIEFAAVLATSKRKPSWVVNGVRRTKAMQSVMDMLLYEEQAKRQPTIDRLKRKLDSYRQQLQKMSRLDYRQDREG